MSIFVRSWEQLINQSIIYYAKKKPSKTITNLRRLLGPRSLACSGIHNTIIKHWTFNTKTHSIIKHWNKTRTEIHIYGIKEIRDNYKL